MRKNIYGSTSKARKRALSKGYRSGLEVTVCELLTSEDINYEYEKLNIPYKIPSTNHTYTPDIHLLDNGIIIETKGRFTAEDRKKHILIKEQHPELDIRFVFKKADKRLRKGSNTTYSDWCKKHGFMYSEKVIPKEWLKEKPKNGKRKLEQVDKYRVA